jgi:hypothetical protein
VSSIFTGAVGSYCTTALLFCDTGTDNGLILRWNGTSWVNGVIPVK